MAEWTDQNSEVWKGIRHSFEVERLAHAYVIEGSPRGNARTFAESFLKLLFCESLEKPCNTCDKCRAVEAHMHVDTLWLEPQSKSRQITADEIRTVIRRVTQTSFEGGWKAVVLVAAECMNEKAANVLLKTLEEPPPKTLILLLTNSPQALLPTIISRCQKLVLTSEQSAGILEELWKEPLMDLLLELPPTGGLGATRLAGKMKHILDVVKKEISNTISEELSKDATLDISKLKEILEARTKARLKEVQSEIFRMLLNWYRDLLMLVSKVSASQLIFTEQQSVLEKQAASHTQASALKATQVIEEMARRLEQNIPPIQLFDEAFRKLIR